MDDLHPKYGEWTETAKYDAVTQAQAKEIAALRASLAKVEADARRYRYVRSDDLGICLSHDVLFGAQLDEALDKEIAALSPSSKDQPT